MGTVLQRDIQDEGSVCVGLGGGDGGARFLFGEVSTTTMTSIVASTSTAYPACVSGTTAVACAGRRRKRQSAKLTPVAEDSAVVSLDASTNEDPTNAVQSEAQEKLGFTI